MPVRIVKADGTQEDFNSAKLLASLEKSGASQDVAEHIVAEVEKKLTDGVRTADIYRDAFTLLRKKVPTGVAARYSLRRALLELGPSGFPFEAYLAELFRKEGFDATTNVIRKGRCVEHEIDVLLNKDSVHTYVEAKFHNTPGFKTDLKVVLYVNARIQDLREVEPTAGGLVVTNTKFTSVAMQYAKCASLPLLSWEHPHGSSLQIKIEKAGLYPITALASLSKREKLALLSQKIVLCNAVPAHADLLRGLGLKEARLKGLFEEIGSLCG
jgi:hypothetical protein